MKRKLGIILALVALLALWCCGAVVADGPTPVLTLGETTQVTITTGGEIAYFSFVPEQDGTYYFYSEGSLDTYGYLYDADMNQLATDDDSGEGSNFKVSYALTAGTQYCFGAKLWGTTTGVFSVTLDTSFPVSIPENQVLTLGETTQVTISTGGETAYFSFVPEQDGTYYFYSEGNLDTRGYLFDADMNQLTYNDDGGVGSNFMVSYALTAGTQYYFGANLRYTTAVGVFSVTLNTSYVISIPENQVLTLGETTQVTISTGGETAYFSFVPEQDGAYSFYSEGSLDTLGYLYDAAMNQLATDDDGGEDHNFKVTYALTAGTQYYYGARLYSTSETGAFSVTLVLNMTYTVTDQVLTISGSGPMDNYSSSTRPWPNTIQEVIIQQGVTSIGSSAFEDCSGLTSVTIPSSVTSIGSSAFYNCSGLTSVTIPSSVTSIENYTFYGCSSLTSIVIPNSVTSIGFYAVSGCTGLTSVTIPSSVTSIGTYAFDGCSSLTSATVLNPSCVIGDEDHDVFDGTAAAFVLRGWPGSTAETCAVAAGHTFESLGALSGSCGAHVTWTFDPVTGVLTISGTGPMAGYSAFSDAPWYDCRSQITSIVIQDGVTGIGYAAFTDCTNMTSVTIPDSVAGIDAWAFFNCTGVTSVTIPDSVTSIGNGAFSGCENLSSVTIPDGVTCIGDEVFYGCVRLTDVTIPDSVTSIGFCAFSNCSSLTSATILNPSAVIGDSDHDVFTGTAATFTLHGWPGSTAETYAAAAGHTFVALTPEPTFFLPASLTAIESEAFSGIAARAVVIPNTVTSIAADAFLGSQITAVYGYAGSAAETFCAGHPELTFVPIDDDWLASH